MRNALSLREHAAQCLEIARHLSDLAAATKLRAEAARCLAGAQAIELKLVGGGGIHGPPVLSGDV